MAVTGICGQVGATTTAAAVGASTQVIQSAVTLRAVSIGTHSVVISNLSTVTTGTGYVLYGNDSVVIPAGFWKDSLGGQTTLAGLYIVADATTQTVSYFGV